MLFPEALGRVLPSLLQLLVAQMFLAYDCITPILASLVTVVPGAQGEEPACP